VVFGCDGAIMLAPSHFLRSPGGESCGTNPKRGALRNRPDA
jgi:hypothetical protein